MSTYGLPWSSKTKFSTSKKVSGIPKGTGHGPAKQDAKEEAARQAFYSLGWAPPAVTSKYLLSHTIYDELKIFRVLTLVMQVARILRIDMRYNYLHSMQCGLIISVQ